jgi:hypothetical protein
VFGDTWVWTAATEEQFDGLLHGELPIKVAEALGAMRTLIGENDAMAYLVNMAPRLFQLARVLKPTGSLYLHYDPTMSHYLKVLLDSIFGPENFRNEIAWERSGAKNNSLRYGRSHDVILFYTRSKDFTWNVQYTPMSGTGCGPTPGGTGPTPARTWTRCSRRAGSSSGAPGCGLQALPRRAARRALAGHMDRHPAHVIGQGAARVPLRWNGRTPGGVDAGIALQYVCALPRLDRLDPADDGDVELIRGLLASRCMRRSCPASSSRSQPGAGPGPG